MADLIAAAMLGALILYALTGGADFGGGVWDLLATGPLRAKQRAAIDRAIGPIWEANHVWLILVVTVMFTGFPRAFAAIANALHVPLLLLLLAIVMRGAAFTFRHYDRKNRWGIAFSIASIAAPILLGVVIGALVSGELRANAANGWIEPWAKRWPLLVGLFTLALFSYLAAVYLCVEAKESGDAELAEAFRRRAMGAWLASGVLSLFVFLQSRVHAQRIWDGLRARWMIVALAGVAAALAIGLLWARRYRAARFAAAAQVTLVVLGWGASQHPWLMVPDFTIGGAAAPPATQRLLIGALIVGSILLFPSLWILFRSFKGARPFSPVDEP